MSLRSRVSSAARALFGRTPHRIDADAALPIRATYDAVRDGNETVNIWGNADALDADAANSLGVRKKLRERSRYERSNSGQCSGIIGTQANYVIGLGPKLRMQTGSPTFNAMVETRWKAWAKAIGLPGKLRTLNMSKTGDGEAVALLVHNPGVSDSVRLDLIPIECDRLTAPVMRADDKNYIDGVHFDAFGNAVKYDILDRHPGAAWSQTPDKEFESYDAEFVCHWFNRDRAGQHRGVPQIAPTLNTFGTGRRWREAVVAGAETAADFSALVEMGMANEGNDEVAPFTTLPIEKRTLMALPAGASAYQMKAEQPTTNYKMLNDSLIADEARPLHMPRNIAACDSSGYSFSGGMLDHQTYFVSVEIDEQDCEEMVVDKVFLAWFRQATHVYVWRDLPSIPVHAWAWPGRPKIDPKKTADARKVDLSTGSTTPSEVAAQDGEDYEDREARAARDYGITVEEYREKLIDSNFQKAGGAPGQPEPPDDDDQANAAANRIGHLLGGSG